MRIAEAHAVLRGVTQSDEQAALAVCLIIHEAARLRQLLRDLVDFNIGGPPGRDALCAVKGPHKLARMEIAWEAAIAEVGPRNERRYEGDEP